MAGHLAQAFVRFILKEARTATYRRRRVFNVRRRRVAAAVHRRQVAAVVRRRRLAATGVGLRQRRACRHHARCRHQRCATPLRPKIIDGPPPLTPPHMPSSTPTCEDVVPPGYGPVALERTPTQKPDASLTGSSLQWRLTASICLQEHGTRTYSASPRWRPPATPRPPQPHGDLLLRGRASHEVAAWGHRGGVPDVEAECSRVPPAHV